MSLLGKIHKKFVQHHFRMNHLAYKKFSYKSYRLFAG